jgi:hypothetical protein
MPAGGYCGSAGWLENPDPSRGLAHGDVDTHADDPGGRVFLQDSADDDGLPLAFARGELYRGNDCCSTPAHDHNDGRSRKVPRNALRGKTSDAEQVQLVFPFPPGRRDWTSAADNGSLTLNVRQSLKPSEIAAVGPGRLHDRGLFISNLQK